MLNELKLLTASKLFWRMITTCLSSIMWFIPHVISRVIHVWLHYGLHLVLHRFFAEAIFKTVIKQPKTTKLVFVFYFCLWFLFIFFFIFIARITFHALAGYWKRVWLVHSSWQRIVWCKIFCFPIRSQFW
jgi:hypothetical protein